MIKDNIEILREKINLAAQKCDRNPSEISMIAVSKTFSSDLIIEASNAGVSDFGENYVQEFLSKENIFLQNNLNTHFIGHLQSNKVKYLLGKVKTIQSVDNIKLANEIQSRAEKKNIFVDIFIEVNTSNETTKFGVNPDLAEDLIAQISLLKNIKIKGLMTIGPFVENKIESRKSFQTLFNVREKINDARILENEIKELSMGMSHDYESAIVEGSTILRIGTAIFGKRLTKTK